MGEPTKEQVEAAIAEHCAFGVEGAAAAVMRLLDRPAPLAPAAAVDYPPDSDELWLLAEELAAKHSGAAVWKALTDASEAVWNSGADREFAREARPDEPGFEQRCAAFDAKWLAIFCDNLRALSAGTAPAQEPTAAMIALDDLRGALEVGSLPNTAWGRTFIESRCRIVVAALRSSAAPPPQDTADSERYKWLTNRVLACDYGDNDAPGEQIGWRIRHDLLRGPDGKRQPAFMFGESIDKAIDAARGHPDTTGDTNG